MHDWSILLKPDNDYIILVDANQIDITQLDTGNIAPLNCNVILIPFIPNNKGFPIIMKESLEEIKKFVKELEDDKDDRSPNKD